VTTAPSQPKCSCCGQNEAAGVSLHSDLVTTRRMQRNGTHPQPLRAVLCSECIDIRNDFVRRGGTL